MKNRYEFGNVDFQEITGLSDDVIDEEGKVEESAETEEEIKIPEDDDEVDEVEEEDKEEEVGDEVDKDDEIADIVSPFSKKKFEAKFPGALKEFPQIERALNTASKYRDVFPTVNDALEAQSNLERYSDIEKDLESGSSKGFLSALKEKDSNSFAKVVDNYLPNLREIDETAYWHVVSGNIKGAIVSLAQEASAKKNDDFLTAAKIINEFFFGESKFTPQEKFSKEENPESSKLKSERESFEQEKLNSHVEDLTGKITTEIGKQIKKYIDPNERMSEYVRDKAIDDANELVAGWIENDTEFQSIKDRLWKRAKEAKFSQESLGNLRRAYISKANTYLAKAIKQVRAKALNGSGSSKSSEVDRKGPLARGKEVAPKGKATVKGKVPEGTDPYEWLKRDR